MKSNYKKLGPYIREIVEKNSQNQIEKLRGVSIQKCFIPSIANTIGTDMTTYKIVRENQFAYGPVTSRNGDKISVALLQESDCIISTSYTVFEIIDHNELLPEYLMMWFRRPEFDRYARFMSHGSVREIFGWEEMSNVELPIPSLEKQKEIVAEYNTIVNRIKLNEHLNQKLEETAQAIYRQWFVDFENNELACLKEYVETNPSLNLRKGQKAKYIEMANISESSMCINGVIERDYQGGSRFQNGDTLLARITPCLENGKTAFVNVLEEYEVAAGSTEFIVMRGKKGVSPFWVYCLAKDEKFRTYAISSMIGSSGRQRVHEKYLDEFTLPKIDNEKMLKFEKISQPFFERVRLKSIENQKLHNLKAVLLAKMTNVGV